MGLKEQISSGSPSTLRAEPQPDPFAGWELWVSTRIADALAAERRELLRAIVKIVGETLAESLAAEREAWESKLRGLRLECAKLSATCDSLHDMISERAKTLDLPALPRRSDLN
jgi:hypothetical protein